MVLAVLALCFGFVLYAAVATQPPPKVDVLDQLTLPAPAEKPSDDAPSAQVPSTEKPSSEPSSPDKAKAAKPSSNTDEHISPPDVQKVERKSEQPPKLSGESKRPERDGQPEIRPIPPNGRARERKAPASVRAEPASEISFSFQDAEWKEIFNWLAELSGRALYIEAMPTDKFTYFDRRKYTFGGALNIVNQALYTKGFVVLTPENYLRIVKLEEGKGIPPEWIDRVEVEALPDRGEFEFVRVAIPLEGIIAEEAKKEYEPLKSKHGSLVALPSRNQLLVVDRVRVVRHILDLMHGKGTATLKVFSLKFINVLDAEKSVRQILGMPASDAPSTPQAANQQGGRGGDMRGRFREAMMANMGMPGGGPPQMVMGPNGQPMPAQAPPSGAAAGQGPYVSSNERTNTLFVKATPDKLALVAEVIESIDVPESLDKGQSHAQSPRFEVYEVEAGSAEGVATALHQTLFDRSPQARVAAHPHGGRIMVYAVPSEHEEVRAFLKQMRTEGMLFEVIPLRALDASATATIIRSVLGIKKEEKDDDDGFPFFFYGSRRRSNDEQPPASRVSVEADIQQNQLVIRGTQTQVDEIKDLLRKMGEPISMGSGGGPFRTIAPGDDREALLRALEKIRETWPKMNPKTPINIEMPDQTTPPRGSEERSRPVKPKSVEKAAPAKDAAARYRINYAVESVRLVSAPLQEERTAPAKEKPLEEKPTKRSAPAGAPVNVVVDEQGNIHLYSEDSEALDTFENMLRAYGGARSGRPSGLLIKIYYLKAADAQEAAYMLEDVLYESSSSRNRSPFFFGGGNNRREEDTPRARIVPDLRTNSLMVIGPPSEHRKIEQLLEYVDRQDPPEAGIFGEPQILHLQYARAKDVADVLKQVFAARVFNQPQQGQQGPQGGGFMGFGGSSRRGGSRSEGGDAGKGKVFIGIEERSNAIVVLAPRYMFSEIETLVKQLDKEAREHKRVSKVVSLRNAKPETIEKAMGTLFGAKTPESEKKKHEEAMKKDTKKEGEGDQRGDRDRGRGDRERFGVFFGP